MFTLQNFSITNPYPLKGQQYPEINSKGYDQIGACSQFFNSLSSKENSYRFCQSFNNQASTIPLTPQIHSCSGQISISSFNSTVISLETQIKEIVTFFVNNYYIIRMKDVYKIREKYAAQNEKLGKIFDALATKYSSSKKPKEELVKWIIRKVFLTGKKTIKDGKKMTQKDLSTVLCKRYLLSSIKEEYDGSFNNNKELAEELLPYKKTSKFKTINKDFIEKLFASEEFQNDFENFLDRFDEIIQTDATEKIQKLTQFVLVCVENGKIYQISKYKRTPWLNAWAEKAKKIAIQLENENMQKIAIKQIKLEDFSSSGFQIKSED